jgi:predicted enzyme related to lactoylglutathione lyase
MATKKKGAAKKKKPAKKAPAKKKPAARAAAPKKASHPAVVWWEVQSKDPARAQQFFGELFGWKVDSNNPMSYGMVEAGKDGIGGGIGGAMGAARTTFYVEVKDINSMLDRVGQLGGRTVMPRTDIGMVIMAQFEDSEGNLVGLIETR